MTDAPQTAEPRKDGLHCVYGKCRGVPYGPYPCHPGCSFQMSVLPAAFPTAPAKKPILMTLDAWQLQPETDSPGLFIQCTDTAQREAIMRALGWKGNNDGR